MVDLTNPQDLAAFGAALLPLPTDPVHRWRMLEYWLQVELFRRLSSGAAPGWRPLGDFEFPYWTASSPSLRQQPDDQPRRPRDSSDYDLGPRPRSGWRVGQKWVDLGAARNDRSVLLVEMKSLGRSENRLWANSYGVGKDLAALRHVLLEPTIAELRAPGPATVDGNRRVEWSGIADSLRDARSVFGAVVVHHRGDGDIVRRRIDAAYKNWAAPGRDPMWASADAPDSFMTVAVLQLR